MDGHQFDDLVRTISSSRRALLGLGAALGLPPLLADARKRKKKKKKCKGCPICQRCKRGKCRPVPNGAACDSGTCQNGACACLTECCGNQDCPTGAVCLANGSCATTCTADADCPAPECVCGQASVEGPRFCARNELFLCEGLQECSSTATCAAGRYCQPTGCPGNPNRCLPLCGA